MKLAASYSPTYNIDSIIAVRSFAKTRYNFLPPPQPMDSVHCHPDVLDLRTPLDTKNDARKTKFSACLAI